jgi:hypothetical protein
MVLGTDVVERSDTLYCASRGVLRRMDRDFCAG